MSADFTFKKFAVVHGRTPMKVGTDGVLLGAWCSVGAGTRQILDIGTGCGLIALMAAQRTAAIFSGIEMGADVDESIPSFHIDAVEPHQGAAEDAGANFESSPWAANLNLHHTTVQSFVLSAKGKYDLIVCNPPFFSDDLLPPDRGRASARHTIGLPSDELFDAVDAVLKHDGIFSVIAPFACTDEYVSLAQSRGMKIFRRTDVFPKPDVTPKRSLMEFIRLENPASASAGGKIVIETDIRHSYSDEYTALTRDFYLKF